MYHNSKPLSFFKKKPTVFRSGYRLQPKQKDLEIVHRLDREVEAVQAAYDPTPKLVKRNKS